MVRALLLTLLLLLLLPLLLLSLLLLSLLLFLLWRRGPVPRNALHRPQHPSPSQNTPAHTCPPAGRVAAHVPLSQHTESVVFNPRYPRLLAYAGEPVPQGYRDKGREVVAGKVCILNIGAK